MNEARKTIFKANFLKFTSLKTEEKVYYKLSYENGVVRTNLSLVFKSDNTWVIKVFGKTVPPLNECFGNFPWTLSLDILENFGMMLQALKLCKSNYDFDGALVKYLGIKEPFPGVRSGRIALA